MVTSNRFTIFNVLTKCSGIQDNGKLLTFDEVIEILNKLNNENIELHKTIETICEDYEEAHGMDIRNSDWFTAW